MRHWLFHPIIFFPLACVFAVAMILFGFGPRAFDRPVTPQSGRVEGSSVVLAGDALASPQGAPEQVFQVDSVYLRANRSLRVAVRPNLGPPAPEEAGIRVLLTPATAARLVNRPMRVDVSYRAIPISAASALAVRLDGDTLQPWAINALSLDQPGVVRFDLPAQAHINAFAIRAISDNNTDFNYGVEITQVRLTPID